MKNLTVFFVSCLLLMLPISIMAQSEECPYQSTLSLNAGFSMVGSLIDAQDYTDDTDVKSYSYPAIQLTYDYNIEKWFSVGLAASYQMMGIEYSNWGTGNENFKTDIKRLNVAFRPLFHYGNTGRIDMYSGLRIGLTNWTIDVETDDPDYDYEDDVTFSEGINFSPQLILYGIRGYVTDNIGLNMELAIGSPHYITLGFNYRF